MAAPAAAAAVEAVLRHEAVEVVEALVVTHVGDHVPVAVDDDVRPLVLEPAHRGVLHRGRARVRGVDLDDPAEPVRLVGVGRLGGVPARVEGAPAAGVLRGGEAVPLLPRVGPDSREVLVDVLLARQHRPPGRGAAGAVVHRAAHAGAGRVLGGLQQVGAGGRAVEDERGVEGDPAVEPGAGDVAPGVAPPAALELDDGHAVRRPGGAHDRLRVRAGREHDGLVGVLVVAHQEGPRARPVGLDDVEVVVVVAELPGLGLRRLPGRVERRRSAQDRVAPADDRVPVVAGGDRHVVDGGRDRRDRGEGQGAPALPASVAVAVPVAVAAASGSGDRRGPDHAEGGRGEAGAHDGAASQGLRGHVAEVRRLGGVGCRHGAGVAAAEVAGDGAAVAVREPRHRQVGGNEGEERARGGVRHGVVSVPSECGSRVGPTLVVGGVPEGVAQVDIG